MARLTPALESLLGRDEPERRLGPFSLVEQLGRGGFAPVWLAKEIYGETTLRTAAVKLFALESDVGPRIATGAVRQRIIEEARALCQVEHPSVVRFYSLPIDEARGVMGLAMEHVAGTSLDRRIAARGRLDLAETLAVGTAIASALSAVHRAGLVHRDVKPANVVEAEGVYKLIDFGIAAADALTRTPTSEGRQSTRARLADLLSDATNTRFSDLAKSEKSGAVTAATIDEGPLCGTLGYIDPSCLATGAPADAASDLYALGAMLFECLGGRVPAAFGSDRGGPSAGLRGDVLDGRSRPPPLLAVAPDAPPSLARLVDALLSPDPAERPASAESVAIDLAQIQDEIAGLDRALPPESVGPFRGLGRFLEGDQGVYFGRASEISAALEMLRVRGLVALVGPSGSGKSSLARAGVLPAVARGALGGWPKRWDTAVAEPGRDPRAAVTLALAPIVSDAGDFTPAGLITELADHARATGRGVVLLIDQLEELATLGPAEAYASVEWTTTLLRLLGDRPLPGVRAVVTVRRDLLDALLALGSLGKALIRGSVLIEPITSAGWTIVLDHALAAYGYTLEDDDLKSELADEIERSVGAMPLLQFALTELWQKRDPIEKKVTRAGLASIGGLAGALERHADATLRDLAHPRAGREPAARAVLLALTTPQGTRASRTRSDLVKAAGAEGGDVVDALERARLVVSREEGLTLAHEALLTQWAKLRAWVSDARGDRLLAEEIERDAARWRASPELVPLWQKHRLAFGEALFGRADIVFSADATAFLKTGRKAERRRRLAVAGAVAAFVLGIAGVATAYVRAVKGEGERTRQALQREQQSREVAERQTREVQDAQSKIDKLLRDLADSPSKEVLLTLKEQIREAKGGAPPPSIRAGLPRGPEPKRPSAPAATSEPADPELEVQTKW